MILATQFRDAVAQSVVATLNHVVAKMAFAALWNLELMTFYSANWSKLTLTVRPCVQILRFTTFRKRLLEFVPTALNEPWLCRGNLASFRGFLGWPSKIFSSQAPSEMYRRNWKRSKMGRIRLDNLSLKEFWIAEEWLSESSEKNISTFHERTFTQSKLFESF